jgi:transposase-like protein/transposase Tn5 family protein
MVAKWVAQELGGTDLGDRRWNRRLLVTVSALSARPEASVPQACERWAVTKGTYRLWAAKQIEPEALLAPHIQQTARRCQTEGRVLVVQDTTTLNFSDHVATTGLGPAANGTGQGLFVHTALAVSLTGVPLGLLYQTTWTRSKVPPGHRRSRTTQQKESQRWLSAWQASQAAVPAEVHTITVADREADLYDFFAQPRPAGQELLVRASQDRRVAEAEQYVWATVRAQPVQGRCQVDVPRHDDQPSRTAELTLRWTTVHWQAPHHRAQRGQPPALAVQVLLADEETPPAGVERLSWLLVTTLPLTRLADAQQVLLWYTFRWRIERFHFVLKSGCQIERLQLARRAHLDRALRTLDVIAWHLVWLTYLARQQPSLPCTLALAEDAWQVLYYHFTPRAAAPAQSPSVQQAVRWIAQLGGFLGRKHDGQPGVKTLWRGLRRLEDLTAAWRLAQNHPAPNLTSPYG